MNFLLSSMLLPSSKSLINCCAALVASAFVLKPDLRFLPDFKLGCLTSYCHDELVLFLRFVTVNVAIFRVPP
ncbi:hypothetical protein StB20like_00059 [Staphylococcus phage StB20-like]|uniref:hypothetical protein n=1 Tax=Staphylococcus phage StB20-like TaxID=1732064 RepID=UPI000706945D|nr:hypothetical protein AVU83_gp59 [Staphylococcus phage StB20-like]ALH46762.1 hypothetical protein StB20like_00059 [Staphylococcus phage StB20-like]